jgi:hypothetical protein
MKVPRQFLALAGLAMATPLSAQIIASARPVGPTDLLVGMRSEVTFAKLPGSAGFASRPGYTFGPQIGFPLTHWFAIQTEVLYTTYGAGTGFYNGYSLGSGFGGNGFAGNSFINGNPLAGNLVFTGSASSAQFLQIPVLARVSVGHIGPVKPVFYAGPMASWMFSCTAGFDPVSGNGLGCGGFAAAGMPTSQFAGMSRWDVGGMAGAGLQMNFWDVLVVSTEMRYQRGLRSVSPLYPEFRNESFSLGFRMGAGSKLLPWGNSSGPRYGNDGLDDAPTMRTARGGVAGKKATSAGFAPGVRM